MQLATKSFTQIVIDSVAAIQAATLSLQDLTIGSILRAIVEANAAIVLFLQGLIAQLLTVTRAATSSGTDLDSWMLDYGLVRNSANFATGIATFSRFTPTLQAVVPIGALIQSADGAQNYSVFLDTANVHYSSTLGGYTIAPGISSVDVPIIASVAGTGANVGIGQISVLKQVIPYVDTVTNAAALTNGDDGETDDQLRTRFIAYIASLSKATVLAIGYAIETVQSNLNYTITENYNYDGSYNPGFFYVVVDDGTGSPTTPLLDSVGNAIEAVRPATVTFAVFAPVTVTANVSATITTDTGYTHSALVLLATDAITNYINGLKIGETLHWSRIWQVAYDASPGIIDVSLLLINGGTSNITTTNKQVIITGTVAIL